MGFKERGFVLAKIFSMKVVRAVQLSTHPRCFTRVTTEGPDSQSDLYEEITDPEDPKS